MNEVRVFPQTSIIINSILQTQNLEIFSKENINDNVLEAIYELVNIYIRRTIRYTNFESSPQEVIKQAFENVRILFQCKLEQEEVSKEIEKEIISVVNYYLKDIIEGNLYEKPSINKKSFYEYLKDLRGSLNQRYKNRGVKQLQLFNDSFQESPQRIIDNINQYKKQLLLKIKSRVNFEIIEIGFDNFLEGLIASPILSDLDEYTINLGNIPEEFFLRDNQFYHFPFEISHNSGFLFILDDDGTIFIFVENLPNESLVKAGNLLVELAAHLYK